MDHREGIPSDGVAREDIDLREWTLQRISSVGPRRGPERPPVMDEAQPRSARSSRGGSPIRGMLSFFGSVAMGLSFTSTLASDRGSEQLQIEGIQTITVLVRRASDVRA